MSFLIWLIYVCFASAETEFNVYSVNVRKATDFEFVAVVSALSAAPHNTMWASGTSDNPCEAPWPCIQFYPSKRSVQISGKLRNGYAAITFLPENPDLATIAVVLVEGNVWVPDLPNVQCKKSIDLNHVHSDKLILVFDEDIKDIILNGEIQPFFDGENKFVLKLLRPYEPNRNWQRKLMRVTGKMDNTIQTFTLAVGLGRDATYNFLPSEEATMPTIFLKLLEWPKRSNG
uniref:Uncharacterized protein n=1 Tax=Schistocephalus solidus TaxID=70667 RepID=A0A0X3NFX6_SCHSO